MTTEEETTEKVTTEDATTETTQKATTEDTDLDSDEDTTEEHTGEMEDTETTESHDSTGSSDGSGKGSKFVKTGDSTPIVYVAVLASCACFVGAGCVFAKSRKNKQ